METRRSYSDRRNHKRAQVSFNVFYRIDSPLEIRIRIGDKEFAAVAIDIGEGGMALLTNHDIPAPGRVSMNFTMYNDKAATPDERRKSAAVVGEIRYCSAQPKEKAYRIGIRYLDLSREDRSFIAKFVQTSE
jgi:c-di-GMP-binding flagellar brake protein YcgR